MSPEFEPQLCGCGTPRHEEFFWHRLDNHECMFHAADACDYCRCVRVLVFEVEQYLDEQAA